ncbi:MAG: glycerol-3-phosphate acyltransferase [Anaerolineae bacterium]
MTFIQILIIVISAYLLGSLPNAYFVTLAVKRINIFEVGSGNMGGTNVARTLGLGWGIFTAVLDVIKGSIAVLVAQWIVGQPLTISPTIANGLPESVLLPGMIAAVAAVAGHNWSVIATSLYMYYQKKFAIRGGKGAATAFGTMLVILPIYANVFLLLIGVPLAIITRYASLSVLVSFASTYLAVILWSVFYEPVNSLHILYSVLLAVLIVWRFRENIERLLTGTERRLGERVGQE